MLLLLPQRYVFSSKSQRNITWLVKRHGCCCYHKGTYFQANHNFPYCFMFYLLLLLLPQRYVFSSKSQHARVYTYNAISCCCYHKGTYFQANHNYYCNIFLAFVVVVATTKVRIFKQITTVRYQNRGR